MKRAHYQALNEARRIDGEIRRRMLRIEELETILMPNAIRYDTVKVQHEPVDNLADIVVEIVGLRNEIKDLQVKMIVAMSETRDMIELLNSDRQKDVMTCRYIRCMTQEKTAERLGMSTRWAQKLEEKGKEEIERRISGRKRK